MTDVLNFKFSSDFILARVYLTPEELAAGYERGWISAPVAVELALAKLKAGLAVSDAEESMALLLSDDLDQVDDLIAAMHRDGKPAQTWTSLRPWLYLALVWLWEHRPSEEETDRLLNEIYAEFGYPEEIMHFAGYMIMDPAHAGWPTVDRDSAAYLREREAEYGSRRI